MKICIMLNVKNCIRNTIFQQICIEYDVKYTNNYGYLDNGDTGFEEYVLSGLPENISVIYNRHTPEALLDSYNISQLGIFP